MALVKVLRRIVTEDNLLTWQVIVLDESELAEGESVYVEPPIDGGFGPELEPEPVDPEFTPRQ